MRVTKYRFASVNGTPSWEEACLVCLEAPGEKEFVTVDVPLGHQVPDVWCPDQHHEILPNANGVRYVSRVVP